VGGAPHPDYLLGYDSLDNFRARGLTSKQWSEWIIYLRNFPTPMRRADINSALERYTNIAMTPGAKAPKKIEGLLIDYGKRGKGLSESQIREVMSWGKNGDNLNAGSDHNR